MGRKLTDHEKQQRKLERAATKRWRTEQCVSMMNEAIIANREADPSIKRDYLSIPFIQLMRAHIK